LHAPNVALMFDRPLDGRGTGLLLRVKEPTAVQRAFADWGVVRPLTGDDLARAMQVGSPSARQLSS
jgi:hypothetical protein